MHLQYLDNHRCHHQYLRYHLYHQDHYQTTQLNLVGSNLYCLDSHHYHHLDHKHPQYHPIQNRLGLD